MAITGSRFTIERQKLCLWLESEKRKLAMLPAELKVQRDLELEREFKSRLDRLYNEVQSRPAAGAAAKAKLN
jgi:hypothetical protein